MRILFVAGADARFFALLGALIESFALKVPGAVLHVCDYGFTGKQRAFLEAKGMLLPRPPEMAADLHHFYKKAALIDYLAGREQDADAVVWIDSDMVLVNPLLPDLETIVAAMRAQRAELAICREASAPSIHDFITSITAPNVTVEPFARMLAEHGIGTDQPYLNTGFFAVTEPALLRDWKALTFSVQPHLLLEQNMMNVVIHHRSSRAAVLPNMVWNVHGPRLDEVGLAWDDGLDFSSTPVKVLHATSAQPNHISQIELTVKAPAGSVSTHFKSFTNPVLRRIHMEYARRFLDRHAELLAAS